HSGRAALSDPAASHPPLACGAVLHLTLSLGDAVRGQEVPEVALVAGCNSAAYDDLLTAVVHDEPVQAVVSNALQHEADWKLDAHPQRTLWRKDEPDGRAGVIEVERLHTLRTDVGGRYRQLRPDISIVGGQQSDERWVVLGDTHLAQLGQCARPD